MQDQIYKTLLFTIILMTMSVFVMIAWNMSVVKIFEIREIDFYEAMWLNVLSKILFQNFEITFEKN